METRDLARKKRANEIAREWEGRAILLPEMSVKVWIKFEITLQLQIILLIIMILVITISFWINFTDSKSDWWTYPIRSNNNECIHKSRRLKTENNENRWTKYDVNFALINLGRLFLLLVMRINSLQFSFFLSFSRSFHFNVVNSGYQTVNYYIILQ